MTSRVGSTTPSACSSLISRNRVSTRTSPARRVSCITVVSGGLARLAADHRDLGGDFDLPLLQRAHRAHRDQVARRDDGIEGHAARQQFVGRLKAGLLGADGVDLRGRINTEAHGADRFRIAAEAFHEFRVVVRAITEEREPGAPQAEQVTRRIVAAVKVIAADRQPGLAGQYGAPAHEMRAVFHEFFQARQVGQVVAVAEQDDAVRLAAVLVVLVPVARHLLKGDQQVVAAIGAGARDRAEHRQEEGIDLRFIGRRILKQEQCQGV